MDMEDASMELGGKHFKSSVTPATKSVMMTRDRTEKSSTKDHQLVEISTKPEIKINTHSTKIQTCISILGTYALCSSGYLFAFASNNTSQIYSIVGRKLGYAQRQFDDHLYASTGVAVLEKMVYYSIFGNLVTYFSQGLHLDVASSAKNVNNLIGVSTVSALVGAYIAETHLGRYRTIIFFFIIYCLGLASMTATASVLSIRPTHCSLGSPDCIKASDNQLKISLISLYIIVIGTSANPCYQAFGGDQFDDEGDVEEKEQKASYFNWLFLAMYLGPLVAFTCIVYIQENVGWNWAFAILTTCMLMALLILVANHSNYRKRPLSGSPLTRLVQVLVAATRNWKAKLPLDPRDLYELPSDIENKKACRSTLLHTNDFRFLDKASICLDMSKNMLRQSAWRLCTVTQVEEVKLVVRVMPIWITCLMYGICFSQTMTFFVKQGSKMETHIGTIHIPPASLSIFNLIAGIMFMPIYDKLFIPFARRFTGNMRGVTMLQRIGSGLVLATLSMFVAALVENRRLSIVGDLNLFDNPDAITPMSCFWLIPQHVIMGIANDFTLAGLQEFFYDQLPDNMRSLGVALYISVLGVGSFLTSLIITIIVSVTGHGSHHNSWIVENLNKAHLDKFYWTLAITSVVNFCIFLVAANWYTYKQSPNGHCTQETLAPTSSISLLAPNVIASHKSCNSSI